eukprot:3509168-Pleurochrysis_carterae.AAC.1
MAEPKPVTVAFSPAGFFSGQNLKGQTARDFFANTHLGCACPSAEKAAQFGVPVFEPMSSGLNFPPDGALAANNADMVNAMGREKAAASAPP